MRNSGTGAKRRLRYRPEPADADLDPVLSPDGRYVAFARHTSVAVADIFLLKLSTENDPEPTARPPWQIPFRSENDRASVSRCRGTRLLLVAWGGHRASRFETREYSSRQIGVKVLDFGLAKMQDAAAIASDDLTQLSNAITREVTIAGTLQYMAAEQLQANEIDCRADIFAFGCVLYEMRKYGLLWCYGETGRAIGRTTWRP